MATMSDVDLLIRKLIEVATTTSFSVNIDPYEEKGYTAYTIEKKNGNSCYSDCVIIYRGDKGEENETTPTDFDAKEIIESIDAIIEKANKVI
jgi:hypothetical protein